MLVAIAPRHASTAWSPTATSAHNISTPGQAVTVASRPAICCTAPSSSMFSMLWLMLPTSRVDIGERPPLGIYKPLRWCAVMLFLVVAWACLLSALVLAWVWLQSRSYLRSMHPDACSQQESDRRVCVSVYSLVTLSALLMTLHFTAPAAEDDADSEWTRLANTTLGPDVTHAVALQAANTTSQIRHRR